MFQRIVRKLFLILAAAVVLTICVQIGVSIAPVNASDSPQNMRALLEQWEQKTDSGTTHVTFQLNTPLTKGGDTWIDVPYQGKDQDFDRNWYQIGDDYVCFNERGGQAYIIRCTPFSNIAEVAYIPSDI